MITDTFEPPRGRMAKFIHRGSPATVGITAGKALYEWMPNSTESISENLEFIIYPPGYDRNDPMSECDYCIFIK